MAVVKRSFSIDPDVWAAVQREVGPNPGRVSAFVNEALERHVRITRGLRAVAEWEAEHGAPSPAEIAKVDHLLDELGVGTPTPAPRS